VSTFIALAAAILPGLLKVLLSYLEGSKKDAEASAVIAKQVRIASAGANAPNSKATLIAALNKGEF
jgi:hypothetical protein